MILGWSTGGVATDWMPVDGWPTFSTFTPAFDTDGVIVEPEAVRQGQAIAAEMQRWPECRACGLEECDMEYCLDCGDGWCSVGGYHACPGRPGETDW